MRKKPGCEFAMITITATFPYGKSLWIIVRRSCDGCTSWSPSDVPQILSMVGDDPTTLYIYPDAADVTAVAQAVASGRSPQSAGLYWNTSCLKEIGAPKNWSKESLEPAIARYKRDHPAGPPRPAPICKEP